MSDCGASDVQSWEEEARAQQQNMYLLLGDREWDTWDRSDTTILYRKVGFAMFSLPGNLPDSSNNFTGYSQTQLQEIKRVADVILEKADSDIHFACIFIFGKILEKKFKIPVFKVKGAQNQTFYVDSECCVFDDWRDYLHSNTLPKCTYCYPRDGLYQENEGRVLVDFGKSPACDLVNTANSSGDSPSTSILADHYFYDRSINLNDLEGRIDRLEIVDSALEVAHDRMSASITRAVVKSDEANEALIIAFNVVVFGCLTVNGLETLNDFISIVDKANKDTLTPLDIFHFSTSALFFLNNLFLANSVERIIENAQNEIRNHHFYNLTLPLIEELVTLSEQVQGQTQMHESANKVKEINHIGDSVAFYQSLVTTRDDLEDHEIQPELININDEIHIAANKLVQISKADFRMILEATEKVKAGAMNDDVYRNKITKILNKNRLKMQFQRREAISQLEKAFNTDNLEIVKIGDEMIFKNMTPSELDRLADVMEGSGKKYNPKILEIVNEFSKRRGCKTPRDYCNYLEFTAKYLSDLKVQKEVEFQTALEDFNSKKHENFNRSQFARHCGIRGKIADHFTNQVFDDFCTRRENSFGALEQRYGELERTVLPLNADLDPNFATDAAAVCHCFKHCDFGSEVLTPKEYFEIASQLVNEPLYRRSEQLNQQGDKNIITFTNPIRGAKGVVFETLADGAQSLATVYYDSRVLNR